VKETIHGDKTLESMGEAAGEGGGWVGGGERRHRKKGVPLCDMEVVFLTT
jgi:hypothetical protein